MIFYINRKDLNVEKYDACIKNALNSRIYAFSWYLDIVADHWDTLILNDYEAVMPLPWRQKYLIKYIYPPVWTQQLGVFAVHEISEILVKDFLKAIPKKFRKITIQFNSGNPLSGENVTEKVNYILPLDKFYDTLFLNFRKDRKNRIKQNVDKNKLSENDFEIKKLITIFKTNYHNKIELSENDYLKLEMLVKKMNIVEDVSVKIILDKEKDVVKAGAIFVISKKRIVYLFSSQTDEGRNQNSLSAILNKVIKDNANTDKILDFEGSIIPNLADFFKSFGAKKESYFWHQIPFRNFL